MAAIDLKVCRAVFSAADDDDDDRGFDYKPDRHSRSFVGSPQNQQATEGWTIGRVSGQRCKQTSQFYGLVNRRPTISEDEALVNTRPRRLEEQGTTHLGLPLPLPLSPLARSTVYTPLSLHFSREPRSNLGYSISQLSWHQKVDLAWRRVGQTSSPLPLSSKTRATCCPSTASGRRGQNITQATTLHKMLLLLLQHGLVFLALVLLLCWLGSGIGSRARRGVISRPPSR